MTETIPTGDWQFWAATALAIGAMWLVLRPLRPTRSKKKNAACPGCPTGAAAMKAPRPKHVDLTIGGKRTRV